MIGKEAMSASKKKRKASAPLACRKEAFRAVVEQQKPVQLRYQRPTSESTRARKLRAEADRLE